MLGGHSSHSYQTGTNLYFVYDYNVMDCRPEEELPKYHVPLNALVVEETLKAGGSMVHHHGIGKYRTPWTKEEHGSAYYLLKGLKDHKINLFPVIETPESQFISFILRTQSLEYLIFHELSPVLPCTKSLKSSKG